MLTKSLHTVTAVTKVALYIRNRPDGANSLTSADALVAQALAVFGYDCGPALFIAVSTDPTIIACVKAVTKAMQS